MGYQGVTDVEWWRPSFEPGRGRQGRPKVHVERTLENFPAPTPQPTLCRLWQGAIDSDGYGVMMDNHLGRRKKKYVHRWVYESVFGHVRSWLVVRHKCDNRLCYRIDHLEVGTVADNNRDAAERGHLGPVRRMAPSEIRAVMARRETGEFWADIAKDFPDYSLATIKRSKDYIKELP